MTQKRETHLGPTTEYENYKNVKVDLDLHNEVKDIAKTNKRWLYGVFDEIIRLGLKEYKKGVQV